MTRLIKENVAKDMLLTVVFFSTTISRRHQPVYVMQLLEKKSQPYREKRRRKWCVQVWKMKSVGQCVGLSRSAPPLMPPSMVLDGAIQNIQKIA